MRWMSHSVAVDKTQPAPWCRSSQAISTEISHQIEVKIRLLANPGEPFEIPASPRAVFDLLRLAQSPGGSVGCCCRLSCKAGSSERGDTGGGNS